MEHFDFPSPGLVFGVFLLVTIVPMTLLPAVLFRSHFRQKRALWAGKVEHVVRAVYRGTTVELETPSRVPVTVVAVSLASLYLAVPVLVVGPISLAARVVAAAEIVFALAAAWLEWSPLACIAAVHALALVLAAFANERGNVGMCA